MVARTARLLALYTDGRRVAQADERVLSTTARAPFLIGFGGSGAPWAGQVDDVRIWDVALTQEQVCVAAGGEATAEGECALTSP